MAAHRYWRVRVSPISGTNPSIGELGLRTAIGGPNVATNGANAYASSIFSATYSADKAFDGSAATLWSGANGTTLEWLAYDFGAGNEKDIVEVAVTCRSDGSLGTAPGKLWLEWSDDNVNWTEYLSVMPIPAWTAGLTRTWEGVSVPDVRATGAYAVIHAAPETNAAVSGAFIEVHATQSERDPANADVFGAYVEPHITLVKNAVVYGAYAEVHVAVEREKSPPEHKPPPAICYTVVEPCHTADCDGLDEVRALLPPGQLWQLDRDSVYTRYIRALGDIKTEWNRRICAEWNESNPCKAVRLQSYWADLYGFPECVPLTGAALCAWISIALDPNCRPGSLGFLQRAIDFVFPDYDAGTVTVSVNYPDFGGNTASANSLCADENALVITAPPEFYRFELVNDPVISDYAHAQDGVEPCRRYFIPEIDCLRKCVFPLGLSVGYKTVDGGPDNVDIFGVSDLARAVRNPPFIVCEERCDG